MFPSVIHRAWREAMLVSQKLKALRDSRNVTIRKVELESRRIAAAKDDKRFYISNARLTQLENDPSSEPSLCKIFSLSVIYRVRITDLMRLYNVDTDENDKAKFDTIVGLEGTRLLSEVPEPYETIESLKSVIAFPDKTTLLPRLGQAGYNKADVRTLKWGSRHIRYGYIGLDDFTMYPLIRPGSFVGIDTHQKRLRLIAWHNEYERPIYFVELRNGYACGWCELQGNQFLVIPHHSSSASIRCLTFPKEVQLVGRVTSLCTDCVDQGFIDSKKRQFRSK